MKAKGPGFVVIYRWRLHEGEEESFVEAWSRLSQFFLSNGESLGSRLHRGPEGWWYSYAQWPSAAARDRAFARGSADPVAAEQMRAAIAESLPQIILEPVADFMVRPAQIP